MPVYDFINTFLGICPFSVVPIEIFDIIKQYTYCKEFNVMAYSGSLSEQPQEWIWCMDIIRDEMNVITKYKEKKN